ncbi:MAG: Rho termination factor N-terminal domain-containing protein, partial [Candidatus Deferrimicrobium sp.]|nr:Rho termination factor N-terminal domain-containing protein [Candidatus Deferrimicrobium sp.]
MNLKELKGMRIGDLTEIARKMNVDGAAGLKKQELIFAILQSQTDQEVIVSGEGVLEVLPDGYGFLRAPDSNYLPGPDDIYVSPSQIRRFGL